MPNENVNTEIIETVIETPIEEVLETMDTDNGSVVGKVIKGVAIVTVVAAASFGIPKLVKWVKQKTDAKISEKAEKIDTIDHIIEEKKSSVNSEEIDENKE